MIPDWVLSRVDVAPECFVAGPYGLLLEGINLSDEGRSFYWIVDARYVLRNPRYTYPAACAVTDAAQAVIDRAGESLAAGDRAVRA